MITNVVLFGTLLSLSTSALTVVLVEFILGKAALVVDVPVDVVDTAA